MPSKSADPALVALSQVDLNLLLTLDLLLDLRNVTAAAQRFGVTQSAMSHRLARLREAFDDALLVSAGDDLVLTPKAESLREPLRAALTQLHRAILPRLEFDPESAKRTFVLAGADLAEISMLPPLLQHLHVTAPHIGVRMVGRGFVTGEALAEGEVDFALAPAEGAVPGVGLGEVRGVRQCKLLTEEFVVLVRRDHPRIRGRLTLKRYLDERHVLVAPQGKPGGLADTVLQARGLQRHVAVQVASFLSAPFLIAQSDYLLTCPASLATATCKVLGLRACKPPFEMPSSSIFLFWHERMHRDEGHRWFRQKLLSWAGADAPA